MHLLSHFTLNVVRKFNDLVIELPLQSVLFDINVLSPNSRSVFLSQLPTPAVPTEYGTPPHNLTSLLS